MTVGEIIQTLRVERNMTQDELGAVLGIQRRAISTIESGKTKLTKKNKRLLSEYFGISEEVLTNGNDEEYKDPRRNEKGRLKSSYRANNKYQSTHYDLFKLRFPLGTKNKYQSIAEEQGYPSFQSWIMDAIKEKAGE